MLRTLASTRSLALATVKQVRKPWYTVLTKKSMQPLCYHAFSTLVLDTPTSTLPTAQVAWQTYNQTDTLDETTFLDVVYATQKDTELTHEEKVQRIQKILRDIHVAMQQDPTLLNAFQRSINALMYTFIQVGDLRSAKKVFEGLLSLEHPITPVSVKTMIHGISKHSTRTELYRLLQTLEKNKQLPVNADMYITVLKAFKHFRDMHGCQHYFSNMLNQGLDEEPEAYKIMMEMYRQAKKPDNVLELFNSMKQKQMEINAAIYNITLTSLGMDNSYKKHMESIFKEYEASGLDMSTGVLLTMHWDPLKVLEYFKADPNRPLTIRDYNECLVSYVKKNKFTQALQVFGMITKDENVTMDVFSYGIAMDMFTKDLESSTDTVFELYQEMKSRDIIPDAVVFTQLLSACRRDGDLEHAIALLEEMKTYDVKPNTIIFNSMLNILSSMEGVVSTDLDRASLVWSKMTEMGIRPDTRTYNTYLSIIAKLIRPVEAPTSTDDTLWDEHEEKKPHIVGEMLRMYRYMRRNNQHTVQPDFATYAIVMNSLSAAGQLRSALQVYSDAKTSGVILPVSVYNEIMRALGKGGKMTEAMHIWYEMKGAGVLPDDATYEIVLEICEQLGLSEGMTSIRNQRKLDMNRLLDLQLKKENRMKKK